MRIRRPVRGFTLVEVSVTLVLVGLLLAAASLALGRVLDRERLSGAEANVAGVLAAQLELSADYGSYTSWSKDLGAAAANLDLVDGGVSTGPAVISMTVGTQGTLGLAVLAGQGDCLLVRVAPLRGGGSQTRVPAAAGVACVGSAALPGGEVSAEQVSAVRAAR